MTSLLALPEFPVIAAAAVAAAAGAAAIVFFVRARRWQTQLAETTADLRREEVRTATLRQQVEDLEAELAERGLEVEQLERQCAVLARQKEDLLRQARPEAPPAEAPEEERGGEASAEGAAQALWLDEPADGPEAIWIEAVAPAPDAPAAEPAPAPDAPEAEDDLNDIIRWTSTVITPAQPGRDLFSGDGTSVFEDDLEPVAAPIEGGDDLTLLTDVDARLHARLNALGITSFDEIARWNSLDAQYVASKLPGVSEDLILSTWVFEAQSFLFDRYQQQLRSRRQRTTEPG